MTDRVIIPIAGVGTIVLDAEAYQAALRPASKPSPEIQPEAPLLVDAAKLGKLTSTTASWWESAAGTLTALPSSSASTADSMSPIA